MKNLKYILLFPITLGVVCGCNSDATKTKTSKPSESHKATLEQEQAVAVQTPQEKMVEMQRLMRRGVDVNNKEGLEALRAKDYTKAEKMFLVALRQVDNYRNQSARKAMILNNLASVYEAKEMYAQAVPLLSKAQKLFIKAYGRKHPTVAITLGNMGRILTKQYRYEEASYVYKTAVSLMEESGNTKGSDYKEALDNLLISLRKNGQGLQVAALEKKIQKLNRQSN